MSHNPKFLGVVGIILAATAIAMLSPQAAQAQGQVFREVYDVQFDYTFLASDVR